jgi:RNA polymerase sigma-70 factor, ECF subfamily
VPCTDPALAAEFDRHRSRLIGIAYRLTGRLHDAEDAVQEAWLRLAGLDAAARADIRELGGWLTTVVGRICLDRMRSASARREQYVGPWLPEPIVTAVDEQDPLDIVVGREDMRMAALRVLHELPPDQRLAFVLHDGFEVPFAEIADVLGCTVAAARQHASRARRVMADAKPPPRAPMPEQQRALEEFLTAVSARDVAAVVRALHPQATMYGDGGGRERTARRPVVGSENVARFLLGLLERYGDAVFSDLRPVLVNGDLGLLAPGSPEGTPERVRVAPRVVTVAVRDGQVSEIFDVVNPDKLEQVPFADLRASGHDTHRPR